MKITKIVIAFFFLMLHFDGIAQDFELGKVSIAELQEKQHPKDTAAVAAILFKKGRTSFEYSQENGFMLQTVVKIRIKIYKKEGYDWANKAINYSVDVSPKESLDFSDAVTYNLVNGKIEKTKLKSDGIFVEKINKYWNRKKITMPNVKEGSVIEYEYSIRTPNKVHPRDWDFQTTIPVNYCEYKTLVPEYYSYNSSTKGFILPKVNVVKINKSISITSKQHTQVVGLNAPKTNFSTNTYSYMETVTTYVTEHLPAMKNESFVNNIENYTSSLVQELSTIQFPNEPIKSYATNWNSVVKTIYDYEDFGPELNKTGYFEDEIKALIAPLNSPEEKIAAIFTYVKNNVKWNGFLGYYCEQGVRTAFKNKTGNVGDINLMLTAMLRYAGLEANPVLVSTRDNGIALFPSRTAFNYVITEVDLPSGPLLLDATDANSLPNILPVRDLNWFGRLIRKDGTSSEVDLTPKMASMDVVAMNCSVDSSGKIEGKFQRQLTNHNGMLFRSLVSGENQDTYLEKFENEHGKIEVQEYKRSNEKDLQAPVTEVFSFSGSNLCEVIQDKMYLNPLLFFTQKENPFKQEIREYPIDYSYPFLDKYTINIAIPEGYTVESIPASIALAMEDNLGGFKFLTQVNDKSIQILVQQQINSSIIAADYYEMVKGYYQKMIEKQNEKIVLKKA
ncbi:Transglutaminase-like superfamily protein [Flavobacterium succinicans]|uniref:Transglutaminase-like superfamily protein n=1 Tax=Flavobacterium succinicans TaxID=29536 RepID=A0A1I4VJY0_9FLAO|nr:transglutaminase domain-containing protein [Flavobacterium succinicans]SFN01420.1 Transglutaminase-like superfamily protein [Flavobacterium succinicans]